MMNGEINGGVFDVVKTPVVTVWGATSHNGQDFPIPIEIYAGQYGGYKFDLTKLNVTGDTATYNSGVDGDVPRDKQGEN